MKSIKQIFVQANAQQYEKAPPVTDEAFSPSRDAVKANSGKSLNFLLLVLRLNIYRESRAFDEIGDGVAELVQSEYCKRYRYSREGIAIRYSQSRRHARAGHHDEIYAYEEHYDGGNIT